MTSTQLFQRVISDPKFDPFTIFNLPRDFTLKQLTRQYHKKALRYHPDKGGDVLKYNIVKYAYQLLSEEYEERTTNPSQGYRELKTQSEEFQQQRRDVHPRQKDSFDINRFNTIFSDNQITFNEDENDGYSDWMKKNKTCEVDENTKGIRKVISSDKFNEQFSRQRKPIPQSKIIVYKEPEPTYTTRLKFSDIDLSRPETYEQKSSHQDVKYTDYKDAFTNTEITNVQSNRDSFKSLNSLQQERSNVSFEMSEDKKMERLAMEQLQQREEHARRERIRRQNIKINKHYQKMNSLLLR